MNVIRINQILTLPLVVLAVLTFHWSRLWSHLCPWWDTVFPGLTVLYTDASWQTLEQNSHSQQYLHLVDRWLPYINDRCSKHKHLKVSVTASVKAYGLLTWCDHLVYIHFVQIKVTLHGNIEDFNNVSWNKKKLSLYESMDLRFL